MTIKLVLTPTPTRVIVMGLLMCIESILGALLIVLQNGRLPNDVEFCTMLTVGIMTAVTFFMAFLKTGEVPEQ